MHPQPYPNSCPYSVDASNHHPHHLGLVVADDDELSCGCVNPVDCAIQANQHSFDYYALYQPRESGKIQQSFTAGISIVIQPPTATTTTATFLSTSCPFEVLTHSSKVSLTGSITLIHDEMTTGAIQPPGSPPELTESSPDLTGSQASNPSSLHSSSLSGADTILSDITDFEDIGLDEDVPPHHQDLYGYPRSKHPVPRTTSATMNGNMDNPLGIGHMRELTSGFRRPSYPTLQGHVGGAIRHGSKHSLSLPQGRNLKRGFTSPSTPSLAMTAMSNLSRSRSPSPSQLVLQSPRPQLQPPSPRPLRAATEFKSPNPRRGSWQPSRKSVKELEDEYDDLDEDLPEDASLWNVPLSPRPPPERASISVTTSASVSPGTSPERRSPLRSPLGQTEMRSTGSPQPSPAPHANQAVSGSPSSMSSPPKPRYPRGNSTGALPENFCFPKNRTKTWNVALSELSEEAKYLTKALENHAGISELKQEAAVQNGAAPVRPSMEKLSRAKTSSVELPPLRVNNVMIDPLPVSKEKEKVLSRTRPSWLPPKNPKEEKRHLKEYQRMMEMSREAESRKAAKAADVQCAQDDTKSALLRIWEEHVLPNWDQVVREPRTRELWWRGVSPRSRGRVWERAIGNDLALTEVTYTKALQRAKDMEERIAYTRPDERSKEKAWFDAIRRDIKTVFLNLKIFQHGSPLHDGLRHVLMAYSMYRSDVGYSHGTHVSILRPNLYSRILIASSPLAPAHRSAPSPYSPNPGNRLHRACKSSQPPSASCLSDGRPHQHAQSLHSHLFPPRTQAPPPTHSPLLPISSRSRAFGSRSAGANDAHAFPGARGRGGYRGGGPSVGCHGFRGRRACDSGGRGSFGGVGGVPLWRERRGSGSDGVGRKVGVWGREGWNRRGELDDEGQECGKGGRWGGEGLRAEGVKEKKRLRVYISEPENPCVPGLGCIMEGKAHGWPLCVYLRCCS